MAFRTVVRYSIKGQSHRIAFISKSPKKVFDEARAFIERMLPDTFSLTLCKGNAELMEVAKYATCISIYNASDDVYNWLQMIQWLNGSPTFFELNGIYTSKAYGLLAQSIVRYASEPDAKLAT